MRPAASASDPELNSLRAEVDRMDDALLALIERRLTVTAAMTAAKQEGPWLLLRPAREASILRRLEALGCSCAVRPASQGTPFANVLIVAQRK